MATKKSINHICYVDKNKYVTIVDWDSGKWKRVKNPHYMKKVCSTTFKFN